MSVPGSQFDHLPFLNGGGETGQLIREFNWASSPIGTPQIWPQSLRTAVSMILNSTFPQLLLWGETYTVIYNNAFTTLPGLTGKSPCIGKTAADIWPTVWEEILTLLQKIRTTGTPVTFQVIGQSFQGTPVYGDQGQVAGIYITSILSATETSTQKVIENERNLRHIILQAPVAIAIFRGPEYIVEISNARALRLWGRTAAEVLNKPILDSMPELRSQGIKALLDEVYYTGKTFSAKELPVQIKREGRLETAYVNFVYEPLYDTSGNIYGLITIGTEVTDQFLAHKKTEESEERFRTMAESTDMLIAVGDESSTAVYFNTAWTELTGRPMQDLVEHGWRDLIHPDDRIIYYDDYLTAFNQRITFTGEFRILDKYGEYRWLLAKVPPRFLPDGTFAGYISSCIDITERKEAELRRKYHQEQLQLMNEEMAATNEELSATNEELAQTQLHLQDLYNNLAQSESRFRSLVKDAPVAIGILNGPDFMIESANALILKIWGKSENILGMPIAMALPELQDQPYFQLLQDVYTTGKPYHGYQAPATFEDNGVLKEFFFDFIYEPINDGKTTSIMVVALDVTEQVSAQQELQRAEEMLRFSVEAAGAASWYIDAVTREFIPSRRLKEIFGFDPETQVSYTDVLEQIPEDYKERIHESVESSINNGVAYTMEHPITGYDGKRRWVRALGKMYPPKGNGNPHFSGLILDITEQKQDELRKNDFIGMVSHELKTPLTSLSAYIQMLHMRAQKNEDSFAENALEKVNKQVKKMTSMINGFLNISRLESGKIILNKAEFNLEQLIRELINENMLMLPTHQITLSASTPVHVYADEDKVASVISNLISNAVKYSPHRQTVEVRCEVKDQMALVSIRDEGVGIKSQYIDKLFERYYRVDDQNTANISGFGIGLYLSAEIIQRHNGKIWAESEIDKGSTFYFSLPLA